MKKTAGKLALYVAIICFVIVPATGLQRPELTQTQLFYHTWPVILLGTVLFIISTILTKPKNDGFF